MGFEFKIAEKIEKLKIDGMSCRAIAGKLGFYSNFEIGEIQKVLNTMVKNGSLSVKSGKYFKVREVQKIKGVLRGNKRGFAFLTREDGGEDLTKLSGLSEAVTANLNVIEKQGAYELMKQCLKHLS